MSFVDLNSDIPEDNNMKTFRGVLISTILIVFGLEIGFSMKAHAQENDKLGIFLKSCGYGAAAGAILGIASLAFAENPGGSMNNIARGVSLGLYAGMGMGFYYTSNHQSSSQNEVQESPSVIAVPIVQKGKIEGAWVHILAYQF